jgi:hypothetical protein
MVDSQRDGSVENRRIILRRRAAFLTGALAVATGCDKNTAPPPEPTGVVIGDPDPTSGMPTAAPSTPDAPPTAKMDPPPSTEIPETDCEGDRTELLALKREFDSIYAELGKLHDALPSGCALTDESCVPKHKPLAKRFAAVRERLGDMFGLCSCPAPIKREYASQHQAAARQRLELIRTRIVDAAGSTEAAGQKWDELVRNEATPRPCLSCVQCEPRSACD